MDGNVYFQEYFTNPHLSERVVNVDMNNNCYAITPESSVIRGVVYFAGGSTMGIWFNSGRFYAYKDVPVMVYSNLCKAESVGQFFNKEIRDVFEYTRDEELETALSVIIKATGMLREVGDALRFGIHRALNAAREMAA